MQLSKVNESRYISLFVVSGSIQELSSVVYVNVYLFSKTFSIDFTEKSFSQLIVSIFIFSQ